MSSDQDGERYPAETCFICGCPERTHSFKRGLQCDRCGAAWPIEGDRYAHRGMRQGGDRYP